MSEQSKFSNVIYIVRSNSESVYSFIVVLPS